VFCKATGRTIVDAIPRMSPTLKTFRFPNRAKSNRERLPNHFLKVIWQAFQVYSGIRVETETDRVAAIAFIGRGLPHDPPAKPSVKLPI